MRDFGYWLRMLAIAQLFSFTLANYGEARLDPDNPLLNLNKKPPAPKPLSEIVVESRPKGVPAQTVSTSLHDQVQRDIAGWGGADEVEAGWDDSGADDPPWLDKDDAETSAWGSTSEP
ncbi:MAG: hypothetical protein KDE32_07890 [Novosphingobium sp.]|nr:hypothetical protein [Novosphingobium sp.]